MDRAIRIDPIERPIRSRQLVVHRSDPKPAAGIAPAIVQPVVRVLGLDLTEKALFSCRQVEDEKSEVEPDEDATCLVGEGKAASKFRVEVNMSCRSVCGEKSCPANQGAILMTLN